MKIDVATLFPDLCDRALGTSVLGRARERGVVDVGIYDIRDFTTDRHRSVDDRPYGGGPGMVLRPGPVVRCVERIRRERGPGRVLLLTPRGRRLDQAGVRRLADEEHLILVCGHYEGFDERIRTLLEPDEVSVGDYVLTGGELPALVVVDAVVRLLPGALGDERSAQEESFGADGRLEAPHYTRPAEYRGLRVPDVLTSGDHARIAAWREARSAEITERHRSARHRSTRLRTARGRAGEPGESPEEQP